MLSSPNIFPPPPSAQIDWDSPASISAASHAQVNGYVETRYQASKGQWTEPRLVNNLGAAAAASVPSPSPWPSPSSHSETMIALRHVTPWGDKLVVFRPDFHAARMARSAAAAVPPPPAALFTECVRRAVSANAEFVPPAESDGVLSVRAVLTSCSHGEAGDAILSVHVRPAMHSSDPAPPRDALLVATAENGAEISLHLGADTGSPYSDEPSAHELLALQPDGTLLMADDDDAKAGPITTALARLAERSGLFCVRRCAAAQLASTLPSLAEAVAVGSSSSSSSSSSSVVPVRSVARQSTGDSVVLPDAEAGRLMGLALHLLGVVRGVRGDPEGWCSEVRPTDAELAAALEREQDRLASPPGPLESGLAALGSAVYGLCPGGLLGMLAFFSQPVPCAARDC